MNSGDAVSQGIHSLGLTPSGFVGKPRFDVDESVLVQAAMQIVQEDWEPYLDPAVEFLHDTLQEGRVTLGRLNRV
jgi:hypothetical protein